MMVKDGDAGAMVCPLSIQNDTAPDGCRGARCMAWRPVSTQHGELGYCGMAGTPPRVLQPLMGQTMLTALAGAGLAPAAGAEAGSGILVPRA